VDAEASRQVAQLIENVIAADGVVTPEERDFLRRVMDRLGVSNLEHEPISIDPGRATTTLRNLPADLQARVMALLVEGAIVDGIVQPEEHAILLASAATLGIEATALEERIARRIRSNVPAL
jgi:tellurite resistance protein